MNTTAKLVLRPWYLKHELKIRQTRNQEVTPAALLTDLAELYILIHTVYSNHQSFQWLYHTTWKIITTTLIQKIRLNRWRVSIRLRSLCQAWQATQEVKEVLILKRWLCIHQRSLWWDRRFQELDNNTLTKIWQRISSYSKSSHQSWQSTLASS